MCEQPGEEQSCDANGYQSSGHCASTNAGTSVGLIPENVSLSERAIVMAEWAKDGE